MEQRYESVAVAELHPHPDNPRRGNVTAIRASIKAHGFFGACVVQRSTGNILIGNHRWQAAQEDGAETVPVLWVDVDDDAAKRILIADNRTGELASWDETALHAMLAELAITEKGLDGLSFSMADFQAIAASQGQHVESYSDDADDEGGSTPDVVMADPEHKVAPGEVYHLDKHVLVVGAVTTDWPLWTPFLTGEAVFCPHPSPYLPLSSLALQRPLVMVTSSAYLAGHVLDKWIDAGYELVGQR